MDSHEQTLIEGLFSRMRGMVGVEKDAAAASLIDAHVRENPDAPYLLTQSVLVQEQALQKANARIVELEQDVARMKASDTNGASSETYRKRSSAGISEGSNRTSRAGTSGLAPGTPTTSVSAVPQAGHRSTTSGAAGDRVPAGRDGKRDGNAARSAPSNRPTGGGFMSQAMSTAAGVAGGMLLASGISSLLSGNADASTATGDGAAAAPADTASAGETATASEGNGATKADETQTAEANQSDEDAAVTEAVDETNADVDDRAYQDAGYDDADGGWGGFDDFDLDI